MAKINFYRQPTSNECGATSLRIVLGYYGLYIQAWEITEKFPVQKGGWSLTQYVKAAYEYGLKTEVLELSTANFSEITLPVVISAHSHYAVLYRVCRDKYYVADPAFGKIVYTKEEFCEHFYMDTNSVVLMFSKLAVFKQSGRNISNIMLVKTFWQYCSSYKYAILKSLIIVFVIAISHIMLPFITRSIIDVGLQTSSWDFIEILLAGNIILVLADILGTFVHTYLITHLTNRIKNSMLEDYMSKVLTLKYSMLMGAKIGDFLQRISDNERIQSFLSGPCLNSVVSISFLTVFSLILLYFNSKLFIIYFVFTILYIGWTVLFLHQRKKLDFTFWHIKSDNSKIMIQTFNNIVDVKGFNYQRKFLNKWRLNILDLFHQNISYFHFSQLQEVGGKIILQSKDLILTYFSCSLVLDGEMTLGTLFAIQYILGYLNTPLYRIADFLNQFQLVMISLGRIFNFNNLPDDYKNETVTFLPQSRNLVLRNISYRYPDGTIGLMRINMSFYAGKKYGIVGSSGCGKSTLFKLLCGFIQPEIGDIWLGTTNIKSIDWNKLRENISIDLQENNLIEGSILENIVGDIDKYDEDRLIRCVEIASIRREIENLPNAYNTLIEGDNRKMSRGQSQRLLIARAIYKQADIYLFDEIANCLSPDYEKKIVAKVDSFLADSMRIYVSHRPECLFDSDLIFVMDNGSVIDLGKYEDLVERKRF